ncbi:hypothetical protein PV797_02150 [Clostridiaceae bacterium M8S5]|nr:hypothetical protein PV797_02150 [Clostridiaceae bacterium M8S5]
MYYKKLKKLITVVFLVTIVGLTGCNDKPINKDISKDAENKDSVIRLIEFDDEQKEIIRGLGNNPNNIFYFKYSNVPKELNWLEMSVTHYEKGKLVTDKLLRTSNQISSEGKILCMFKREDGNLRITLDGGTLVRANSIKNCIIYNKPNTKTINIKQDEEFILGVRIVIEDEKQGKVNEAKLLDEKKYKELSKVGAVYVVRGKFINNKE